MHFDAQTASLLIMHINSGHIISPMLDFFSSLRLFIVNEQKVKKARNRHEIFGRSDQ